MSVTIRDVLALDIVQDGEPEVLAGEANLGRPVRWVHIADIADVAPLLKGSELLLTSGLGLSTDPTQQREYTRALTRAGLSGMFMTLGWAHQEAPGGLVDEARRRELPLVVLHHSIPFIEVTEQVHTEILNEQLVRIQRAERIGRDFTDLVLGGSGLRAVVEALGREVNRPVVLENVARQILEYWAPSGAGTAAATSRWERHSRAGHRGANAPLQVVGEGATPGCTWTLIPLRNETWGRLHVLHGGEPLDEIGRLALDRAAIAIALLLLSQRYSDALLDQAGGDLIAELVRGVGVGEEDVLTRARGLGCDLRGRRLAAVTVDADDFAGHIRKHRLDEGEIQSVKRTMLQVVRQAVEESGCGQISSIDGDEVLSIVAVPEEQATGPTIDILGRRVRELLPTRTGGLTATVGVSREATIPALAHAFTEAREAVAYGKSLPNAGGVFQFERLGLDTLILRLRGSAELSQFVETELGPILDHDANRSPKLLPTLQSFLEHGGNKSATAKAVHLQRRSLYHRLAKISDLLGLDLEDPETRTRLHVAAKALAIIRRAPGGADRR